MEHDSGSVSCHVMGVQGKVMGVQGKLVNPNKQGSEKIEYRFKIIFFWVISRHVVKIEN